MICSSENSRFDTDDDDSELSDYRLTPDTVSFARDVTVLSVSCGLHHNLALTSHGVSALVLHRVDLLSYVSLSFRALLP